MVQYSNGIVTMKATTFYITLFVMLLSLASGAYGLSRVYTDSKMETVNMRVDGIQSTLDVKVDNLDDKLRSISETMKEIKTDIRELNRK